MTLTRHPGRAAYIACLGWCAATCVGLCLWPTSQVLAQTPGDNGAYVEKIRPLLNQHCVACHGALKQEGGLRLDASQLIRAGGDTGAIIDRDAPNDSLILQRITADDDDRMPPQGEGERLSEDQVQAIRSWITAGAVAPDREEYVEDPLAFWSYQPIEKLAIPFNASGIRNGRASRNPIDQFLAAKYDEKGLVANVEAAPDILLRRLYIDLIGVPPTADELERALADRSPHAYERIVDRLLADPRYGERWGRHWMDVWRYSDWYGSRGGNEIRYSQRHIWRWRDWIVRSLNENKGYDQMIVEMLAADELQPYNPDNVVATGYIGRNWYKFDRNVWMRELVEHTAMGFMSVSLKCARCHDHKYDPISQLDYYRFRAFFEPHDLRIDPVSATTKTVKDAKLGQVPADGLARVFDGDVAAPTYLFSRGDDRYPVKDNPLSPGVPAALGNAELNIERVSLPLPNYFPALREKLVKDYLEQADGQIRVATGELVALDASISRLTKDESAGEPLDKSAAFLSDEFDGKQETLWEPVAGNWHYQNDHLVQTEVGSFLTTCTRAEHPRDFQARIRYKHRAEGDTRSVGFAFDVVERQSWQAIYTHPKKATSAVQAFHREGGREFYPPEGIVKHPIEIDQWLTIDIVAQGQQLNVWVDGQLRIAYRIPTARRDGRFALWTHRGAAEFDSLIIEELDKTWGLAAQSATDNKWSPFRTRTPENREILLKQLQDARQIAERNILVAKLERESLEARIRADRATADGATAATQADTKNDAAHLAKLAAAAERRATIQRNQVAVLQAELELKGLLENEAPSADTQRKEIQKRIDIARAAIAAAEKAELEGATTFTSIGKVYPRHSSGRRLALAKWIVDHRNPRTSRVAINHIWRHHFGQPLVGMTNDFGLRSKRPLHRDLLDWLANELVVHNWDMKSIHRLIVTSQAYRLDSSDGSHPTNVIRDPNNEYLWRMNSQRMEAEVVRDSVLHLAGNLDHRLGGPEIDEKLGQTTPRRSLYFRITPNEQMPFLMLFDMANPDQCYERAVSVVPQQALALTNSPLALAQARLLARRIDAEHKHAAEFVETSFRHVLGRSPSISEAKRCRLFLEASEKLLAAEASTTFPNAKVNVRGSDEPKLRARENLVHVLFCHNDFLTIR